MRLCRLLFPVLVLTQVAGCASVSGLFGSGPFGEPERAVLVLSRGEAGDLEAEFGEVEDYWRQRLCETEEEARTTLRRRLSREVETAWAEARLDGNGKELPALTRVIRERIVDEGMANARLVGRIRPESGQFESFYGLRLSGRFPACIGETRSGGDCTRPPVMEPVSACGNLTPAPEPLYFLEGA